MESTYAKNILTTLQLIRAGLASGVMTKEEVIAWADSKVTKEEEPDIFFIDLALSSSKNINDVIRYCSEYLNFDNPAVHGRPLLGLLYKRYKSGQFNFEQAINKLFRLKYEAVFNEREENYIYSIENDFDCAKHAIYGDMMDVQEDLNKFLEFYKDYTIENCDQWQNLDEITDFKLEEDYQLRQGAYNKYRVNTIQNKKPWWKFW